MTERQHLEAGAKRGVPEAQAALAGPACPPGAEYVWAWFLALDGGRSGSGFGMNALGWAELDAFARLRSVQMSGQEADWLRALDRERLVIAAEGKP